MYSSDKGVQKRYLITILLITCYFQGGFSARCSKALQNINDDCPLETIPWKTVARGCSLEVGYQITRELNATMSYLNLAAYYSKDVINRPGFAKLFFAIASSKRENVIKLIKYLTMRGEPINGINELIQINPENLWPPQELSGKAALEGILYLEAFASSSINKLIHACENSEPHATHIVQNDYHLVNWLTREFLDEQYRLQRFIAGMLSTLMKIGSKNYHIGEFSLDKKLAVKGNEGFCILAICW